MCPALPPWWTSDTYFLFLLALPCFSLCEFHIMYFSPNLLSFASISTIHPCNFPNKRKKSKIKNRRVESGVRCTGRAGCQGVRCTRQAGVVSCGLVGSIHSPAFWLPPVGFNQLNKAIFLCSPSHLLCSCPPQWQVPDGAWGRPSDREKWLDLLGLETNISLEPEAKNDSSNCVCVPIGTR